MTVGVGGSTVEAALGELQPMTEGVPLITAEDHRSRLERLQASIREAGGGAVYLHAGTNLHYFTGLQWNPSERMVAAVVPAEGEIFYVAPQFELDTLRDYWVLPGEILPWEEHESPYQCLARRLGSGGERTWWIDEAAPFFTVAGIRQAQPDWRLQLAQPLTQAIRSRKDAKELAIIRRAHEMTLRVQRAAASILRPGMTTGEVVDFIDRAHRLVGAAQGSYFCIVLFGVATSFPHGVKDPQTLAAGDWVLVDTGFRLQGYHSDITRSYSLGTATETERRVWEVEKEAQLAAFAAAGLGQPCEVADAAARQVLEAAGFGPDYQLPGLPHRTGHGCGLDIHEGPNLVRGETTPMDVGMVFSNEPMLVLPGELGVRLEDHFYLTAEGPRWLTEPACSVDDPFGLATGID